MSLKKLRVALFICVCCALPGATIYAGDDESLTQKAANQLLDSLPDFVKDVQAMRNMKPQEKIEYIMNAVDGRVKEKVAEKFKDQVKDKVKEYTKAAIRARAFQEIGVPQIRNAFVMGVPIEWSKIDSQIASNVDTKMRVFDAGWKAAEIGWSAYEAYASGDALAAAKSISGSVCDLLAEAYIPGWGWVKFGAKMVEALGNYVLSYATDTAVQGMLESMYGMKTNPQGFADWLIKKSPQDIMTDLNDKWNDGMAFGYLWQGQGTDKGDEEMKSRLQSTLVSLRGELLAKIKEEERKEKEIEQFMQKYKDEAEAKAKELQKTAEQAKSEADAILAPIKAFREKYYGMRKQEVKEQEAKLESSMDGGQGIAYVPLRRGAIIGAYQNVLSEVRDVSSDSAFDQAAYDRMYEDFSKVYKKEREDHLKANDDAIGAATKAMYDAWNPQFEALGSQLEAARARSDWKAFESIQAQIDRLSAQFAPVQAAHQKAVQETKQKVAADRALLDKEMEMAGVEASERGAKLGATMMETYKRINEKIAAANAELESGRKALLAMIKTLNNPGLWRNSDPGAGASGIGYGGPVRQIKEGTYEFIGGPGHLAGALTAAEEEERKLKDDISRLSEIDNFERKMYAAYRLVIANAFKEFESVTPKRIRFVHKPPIFTGSQEGENARSLGWASRTGSSIGFGEEVWSCSGFNYVSFPGGYVQIKGVNIPRDFLDQVDTLLGNATTPYQKALQQLQEDIGTLRTWAQIDEIGVLINDLGAKLSKIFDQYAYRGEGIPAVISEFKRLPEGKPLLTLDETNVLETVGYGYLRGMKAAWEEHGYKVGKFANLAKGYGKGYKYAVESDPKRFINKIPSWQGIPVKIKTYEDAMAQALKESKETKDNAKKQLDDLKAQFKKLEAESGPTTLKEMNNIKKTVETMVEHVGFGFMSIKDDLLEFQKDVDEGIKKWTELQKKRIEEYNRQREAEEAAAREKERLAQEERNKEAMRTADPLTYYGFKVTSIRVNTYSVDNASGDIAVTADKLIQGQIQISAQLNHVDKVKTMLFSEDGGRSWKEIAVDRRIDYSFNPIPNKLYNPFIQLRTEDGAKMNLKLIANAQGIIYKNEDFSQQVVEAVKAISDAYERQDLRAFSDLISRDYAGNKTFLEEGVRFDFDMFADISLRITINRIDQRSDMFAVDTRWDKTQTPRKTGESQKTTGRTTIMLVMEDGKLKIKNLRGNLIYATLSPEIAQASGLSAAVVSEIRTAHDARNPVQPGAGTTDDSGGLAGMPIVVQTSPVVNVPGFPGTGFDFTANAETTPDFLGGTDNDVDFEDNQIFGQNFQRIAGATFESLTSAPTSGYTSAGIPNDGAGAVYAFITREGYYGKLEIISFDAAPGGNLRFRFALQTDGTTSLSTR